MVVSRIFLFIVGWFISPLFGQITQIYTGINAHLLDLSVLNNTVIVCGKNDYLVKSTDECKTLTPINIPAPAGYLNRLQRVDENNLFLLSFTASKSLLYHSADGGDNWSLKLDSSGAFSSKFCFFNSQHGVRSSGSTLSRTADGGFSWSALATPPGLLGISALKCYGDSLIIIGAQVQSGGVFYISKDRGQTWPATSWGFWKEPIDFFFLNNDTVFAISVGGEMSKTTNRGNTWSNFLDLPFSSTHGIFFKNIKEGYVVGSNSQGDGLITKTIDFGSTWTIFNTHIKTTLTNMAILNDSIAILTGSDGVLLRWNYKNTLFTSVDETYLTSTGLKIFPNPVEDNLYFETENIIPGKLNLSIENAFGQRVYSKNNINLKEELDVSFLKSGVYYLKLESQKGQKVFKVMKE